MTATEESLKFPLNKALKENWVKTVVEFPSAQIKDSYLWAVVLWHSVYWWFGPVWSRKSVASAKESSFTYVSVSYWLVCHTGVQIRKGNPNHKSLFFTLPLTTPYTSCHLLIYSVHGFVYWLYKTCIRDRIRIISRSAFPLVPHATGLLYPVFVVLSTSVLHWPRFPIIRKKNDLVFIIHLFFRVHLSNNMICTDTGSFQNGSQREGINNQQ